MGCLSTNVDRFLNDTRSTGAPRGKSPAGGGPVSVETLEIMAPSATEPGVPPDERIAAARLARGFWLLVGATTALIVLGALVRANGAGLACPDWPLCFGQLIPQFDVRVGFEWSHRLLAGSVGLCFLALGALVLRHPTLRRSMGPWILTAGTLLAVQVVLGALTVWELLASWTVSSHLVVGNAVNAGFATIAWQLGRAAEPARSSDSTASGSEARAVIAPALRGLVVLTAGLLLLQLVLGGQVSSRFAGLACDEWPACHGGVWFPGFQGARGIHLFHRLAGYALVAALGAAALAARGTGRPGQLLAAAAGVALAQAIVGIANVLLRIPIEVTAAHSLLAAMLVLLTTLAVCETWPRHHPSASTR